MNSTYDIYYSKGGVKIPTTFGRTRTDLLIAMTERKDL